MRQKSSSSSSPPSEISMAQSIKQLLLRAVHKSGGGGGNFFGQQQQQIPVEIRKKIHQLCADYVGGAWANIRPDDMVIQQLRGGTSNMLFICALPNPNSSNNHIGDKTIGFNNNNVFTTPANVGKTTAWNTNCFAVPPPNELLLRIYFNPNTEQNVVEESVVFTLLAERNLGPKLYGVFAEGRLEEYIHSRALSTAEIRLPVVSAKIARCLARIHQLTMPIGKRPVYLGNSLRKWMSEIRDLYKAKRTESTIEIFDGKKLSLDEFEAELEFVIECVEKSPSPIVFCHNDFQEGNILLKGSDTNFEEAEFGLIDYEYASYNYRAFDVANHFCEWTFDYSYFKPPYFLCSQECFPTDEQQTVFAQNYLQSQSNITGTQQVSDEAVRAFIEEVKPFVPVSHFLWAVWSLLLAETSPVQFGFAEYGRCRMALYYRLRSDLISLLNQ